MSLTIVSSPANISNSAAWNVTTSLVEDSTHVNLRLRADIYHEGVVKASVEKPKGLPDFDFSGILKSLVPGILSNQNPASATAVCGYTLGANDITAWTTKSGTYTTLTTTGYVISSAICTVSSVLESNAVAMVVGEVYLLYSPDFAQSGTAITALLETGGAAATLIATNKGILLIPTSSGNIKINIGNVASQNFSGTFYLYNLCPFSSGYRAIMGSLLAPYFVNFTEVYEDAAGVTQTGATSLTKVYRYVPAKGDGTAFTEYVLHDGTSLFANKTLKNNITKTFNVNGTSTYLYRLCFFTEYVELSVVQTASGGSPIDTAFKCYEGWGWVEVRPTPSSLAGGTISYQIKSTSLATAYSEVLTFSFDMTVIDERVVLEFDGLVGGKEYLAFEGLKDEEFVTIRNYYSGSKKNRKAISFDGICRQRLETRFKDQPNAEYLKSLLIAERVNKLITYVTEYTVMPEVTVITDGITINKGRELFTNQIEIEYEY